MANIGQNFDQKEMLELLKKQNGGISIPQQGSKTNNTDSSLFKNKAAFGSLTKAGSATGLEASLQTRVAGTPAKTQETQTPQTPQNGQSIFGEKAAVGVTNGSVFASATPKAKTADEVLGENDWGGVGLSFSGSQPQQINDVQQQNGDSIIDKVKSLFAGINANSVNIAKNSTQNPQQQEKMSDKQKLSAGKAQNNKGKEEIKANKKNIGKTNSDTNNLNMDTSSAEMNGNSIEAKVNSEDNKAKQTGKGGKNVNTLINSSKNNQTLKTGNTMGANSSNPKIAGSSFATNAGKTAKAGGNKAKTDEVQTGDNNSQNITSMKNEAVSYMAGNNADENEKTSVEKSFDNMEKTSAGNNNSGETIKGNNKNNATTGTTVEQKFKNSDGLMGQSDIKALLATNNQKTGNAYKGASAQSKDKATNEQEESDGLEVAGNAAKSLSTTLGTQAITKKGESIVCGMVAKSQKAEAEAMRASAATLRAQAQTCRAAAQSMHAAANAGQAAGTSLQATGKSLISEGTALLSNPYTASLGSAMIAAGEQCDITGTIDYETSLQLHDSALGLENAATQADEQAVTLDTQAGETDVKAADNEKTSKQDMIDSKSLTKASLSSAATATADFAKSDKKAAESQQDNNLSDKQKAAADKELAKYKANLSQSIVLNTSAAQMRAEATNTQNILENNVNNSKACAAKIDESNEDNTEKAERLLAQVKQGGKADKDSTSSEDADSQDSIEGNDTKVSGGKSSGASSGGIKQNATKASSQKQNTNQKDDKKIKDKKDTTVKEDEKTKENEEEEKTEETKDNQETQENQETTDTQKPSTEDVKANSDTKASLDDTVIKKIQI